MNDLTRAVEDELPPEEGGDYFENYWSRDKLVRIRSFSHLSNSMDAWSICRWHYLDRKTWIKLQELKLKWTVERLDWAI